MSVLAIIFKTAITLSNVLLSDSNGNSLPFTIQNGSVEVQALVTTPEPSSWILMLGAALVMLFLKCRS